MLNKGIKKYQKKTPEFWLDIPGSLRYQISNYGNVRRKLKHGPKPMKPIKTYVRKEKWVVVKVDIDGKYREFCVHKLVAATFLEPGEPGQILYHKNELIRDNYAGNLCWIYPKDLGKKTGGDNSRAIPVKQIDPDTGEIINYYKSIGAAARDNYIHKETICMAIRGQLKTAAGYKWAKEVV